MNTDENAIKMKQTILNYLTSISSSNMQNDNKLDQSIKMEIQNYGNRLIYSNNLSKIMIKIEKEEK